MKVSIIVCTRNRAHAITACLDSISRALQNTPSFETEIVIVNNGSTDETARIINTWAKNGPISVNTVLEQEKGLSKARNTGIRVAQGEIIVFTDDDCIMDVNFINKAIAYDAEDTISAIRGGRINLGDPSDFPITIKTIPHKMTWAKNMKSSRYEDIGNTLMGASMVMRKSLINKIGLFDTRLGAGKSIPAGEDTDYIYRAYLAGHPIEYVPDMIVHHFHGRKSKSDGYKIFTSYAKGSGALYLKYFFIHPNFCRPFYWNCKKGVKEALSGKNTLRPDLDFSWGNMIVNNIKGALMFIYASIFQRSPAME